MAESPNRLSERVRAAIRRSVSAPPAAPRLLVACSGGADSACLAHAAARVAREAGGSLAIAHVRHGLRPDDDADAARVAALAAALALPFVEESLALAARQTPARNIEARLRAARYAALARLAATVGATRVLTGHTLDDQAETVLLRLLRGSGLGGLAGMAADSPFPTPDAPASLRLLRPLLTIRRAETRAYCAAHAVPYADDPTNDDTRFTRNWLRHEIMPALADRYPAVAPTLARTAALLREDAAVLDAEAQAALRQCAVPRSDGVVALDAACFAALAAPVRRRLLRAILLQHGESVRADRLRDLDAALNRTRGAARRIGTLCCLTAGEMILIGAGDRLHASLHCTT